MKWTLPTLLGSLLNRRIIRPASTGSARRETRKKAKL